MNITPDVLVLNASNEPLNLVAVGRALALVMDNRAEVVRHDGVLRTSTRRKFPRPTVIRLLKFVHIQWRSAQLSPRNLALRDGGICQWCRSRKGETIDHVIPRSRGGQHVWENVVHACKPCNNKKGSQLASEIGWVLLTKPVRPSRSDLVARDPRVTIRTGNNT